jgi:hypothetical protein
MGQNQIYLKSGQTMRLGIDGLSEQQQTARRDFRSAYKLHLLWRKQVADSPIVDADPDVTRQVLAIITM